MSVTPNFGLETPVRGTKLWDTYMNSNMNLIDTELKNVNDDLDVATYMEDAGEETVVINYNIVTPPNTATSTGIVGQIAFDSSYFYVCVSANTWKRVAISTW